MEARMELQPPPASSILLTGNSETSPVVSISMALVAVAACVGVSTYPYFRDCVCTREGLWYANTAM